MGRKLINIIGNKYNKLTVVSYDEKRSTAKNHYWICRCDCGNYKSIEAENLKSGTIKACGCLQGGQVKYKYSNNKLYKKWQHMMSRCYNIKDISYKNYGLRNIKVSDEWHDYDNFAKWALNNGYSEELELDRIDTNGNYSSENCRFINHLENSRNRRKSLRFNYEGKNISLMEISQITGISYKTLWKRLKDNNYDISKCLAKEVIYESI